MGLSMISEKVDAIIGAYFTHESILLKNEGHPVNVMRMEEWGVPDYYELVMVTSEDYLSENTDVVGRFIRAVRKGYTDAISDPQTGVDILKKYAPEIDEDIDRPGADLLQDLWKGKNGRFGTQEEVRWVSFSNWMKARNIIDANLDPKAAFTDEFSSESGRWIK
ncbi:TPA: hypothetical protein EYO77_13430 [Candidatus Poribacteria bacterium]|nr:hypothetical protein [Candidatus Poribacteria bacterium]